MTEHVYLLFRQTPISGFSLLEPRPHRKDLKSRSPNLGPYTTKGYLKGARRGHLFLDPSGGLARVHCEATTWRITGLSK